MFPIYSVYIEIEVGISFTYTYMIIYIIKPFILINRSNLTRDVGREGLFIQNFLFIYIYIYILFVF